MVNISGSYGRLKTWVTSKIAAITLRLLLDVDDSDIGNDKVLAYKTASGKHEYVVGGGGGGVTDHGDLTGLADDDHPQYTQEAEVDAIVATHTAISAAHHSKYTDAEVNTVIDDRPRTRIFAKRSFSNQSISTLTWTKVIWNNEIIDTANEFANARFTAKTAGFYIIGTGVMFRDLLGHKVCYCKIKHNGVQQFVKKVITPDVLGNYMPFSIGILDMNVNDYVEIDAYHSSGSGITIDGPNSTSYLFIFSLL